MQFDPKKLLDEATDDVKQKEAVQQLKDMFQQHPELAQAPETAILTLATSMINHGVHQGIEDIKSLNKVLGTNFPTGDLVMLAALACGMQAMLEMTMKTHPGESMSAVIEGYELGSELLLRIQAFKDTGLGEIKHSGLSSSVKFNRKDFKND